MSLAKGRSNPPTKYTGEIHIDLRVQNSYESVKFQIVLQFRFYTFMFLSKLCFIIPLYYLLWTKSISWACHSNKVCFCHVHLLAGEKFLGVTEYFRLVCKYAYVCMGTITIIPIGTFIKKGRCAEIRHFDSECNYINNINLLQTIKGIHTFPWFDPLKKKCNIFVVWGNKL